MKLNHIFPYTQIYKGAFTRAYMGQKHVLLVSNSGIKEGMSLYLNEENKHLPKIERIGEATYIMPRYQTMVGYHPDYKLLQKAHKKFAPMLYREKHHNSDAHYQLIAFVATENEVLAEALDALLSCAMSYTSLISFDLSPRNVSVQGETLIIRDVYENLEAIRKYHRLTRWEKPNFWDDWNYQKFLETSKW